MKALIAFAIALVLVSTAYAVEKEAAFLTVVMPIAAQSGNASNYCFGISIGEQPPSSSGTVILPDGDKAFVAGFDKDVFFRVSGNGTVKSVTAVMRHENKAEQSKYLADVVEATVKLSQRDITPSVPAGGNMITMSTPGHLVYVVPHAVLDNNGHTNFQTWVSCIDK